MYSAMPTQTQNNLNNDTTIFEIVEMNPKEIQLIRMLRNLKWGEIVIELRDGVPYLLRRIRENFKL